MSKQKLHVSSRAAAVPRTPCFGCSCLDFLKKVCTLLNSLDKNIILGIF